MGPRLSLSKAYTILLQINLTAWVYDPSVNQTAKSYFTMKVNKSQKQSETKLDGSLKYYGANCSHQQTKILISSLQTMERRMEYTL
jgi:hypothetical protein